MHRFSSRLRLLQVFALSVCVIAGCSSKSSQQRKIRKKEGIAQKIDVENRMVSMIWTDDKGEDHPIDGTFTDDTVVEINGRSQEIKDIRPGDKVVVYGYSEGKGDEKKLIATRVVVTRPKEADWKTTGADPAKAETPAGQSRLSIPPIGTVSADSKDTRRQDAEDLIYANIRVRMDKMIQKRKELLASGRAPSDVEIRKLEGSIIRARDLLLENGESVEPVDPPILETKPRES